MSSSYVPMYIGDINCNNYFCAGPQERTMGFLLMKDTTVKNHWGMIVAVGGAGGGAGGAGGGHSQLL